MAPIRAAWPDALRDPRRESSCSPIAASVRHVSSWGAWHLDKLSYGLHRLIGEAFGRAPHTFRAAAPTLPRPAQDALWIARGRAGETVPADVRNAIAK